MKYEPGGSRTNHGQLASYHCGFTGCSVRFSSAAGYHMLFGMRGQAYAVDEPSVNTMKCPIHGRWLYRRKNNDAEPRIGWFCGVEDCHYGYIAKSVSDSEKALDHNVQRSTF